MDPHLLDEMVRMLNHRGPDESGVFAEREIGLANARLSVIDLETGQQPMTHEDAGLSITFNGEIYNYIELREELEAGGHTFRTRSDTEVLLHLYEAHGDRCVRADTGVCGGRDARDRRGGRISRGRRDRRGRDP